MGLALLHSDNAIPSDVLIHLSDYSPYLLVIISRYRSHVNEHLIRHLLGLCRQLAHHLIAHTMQMPQHRSAIYLRCQQPSPLKYHSLCQDNRGGCPISCTSSGTLSCLLHHPNRKVLYRIKQVNSLGYRNTILRNRDTMRVMRRLNQHRIAPWAKGTLYCISNLSDAINQLVATLLSKDQVLG